MMTCRQVEDLAPLYVAGALRVAEASDLEAHLSGCPLHAESLATLRDIAYAPASDIEEVALPPALKGRIMAAVREDVAVEQRGSRAEGARPFWLQPRLALAGAVAVVVLALAGALAWDLTLRSDGHANEETFAVALRGNSGASGAYYYSEGLEGVIIAEGLSPLATDKTYQVWAQYDGTTVNCGLLAVAQTGPAFAHMTAEMPRDARIFVTVEPAGGSPQPTGATVLSNR